MQVNLLVKRLPIASDLLQISFLPGDHAANINIHIYTYIKYIHTYLHNMHIQFFLSCRSAQHSALERKETHPLNMLPKKHRFVHNLLITTTKKHWFIRLKKLTAFQTKYFDSNFGDCISPGYYYYYLPFMSWIS